jgi:WD40 repeat protein
MRLNRSADLSAVSLFDGSIKIMSTMSGDVMYEMKDVQMNDAVTSLAWKPVLEDAVSKQTLLGACLDGSIVRWTANCRDSVEHFSLNEENSYHAIDCSDDNRKFCVAGSQPYIELYDETRMTKVQ